MKVSLRKHSDVSMNAAWSAWTDWGPCSSRCEAGIQQRARTCLTTGCHGDDYEQRTCQLANQCAGIDDLIEQLSVASKNTRTASYILTSMSILLNFIHFILF